MIPRIIFSVALIASPVISTLRAADLTLIEEGNPRSIIVLADKPSAAAREAAAELRDTLLKMSGAELQIVSASDIEQNTDEGAMILVGDSPVTQALGYDSAQLDPEAFRVFVDGQHLILLGSDRSPSGRTTNGTYFAAATFEEQVLGCRWLWPGDAGTVIPQVTTIAVDEDLELQQSPAIPMRGMRNVHTNIRWFYSDPRFREFIGWDESTHNEMKKESSRWGKRQKLGASKILSSAHAYRTWYEEYHDTHPDWFAQQLDGSRDLDTEWLRSANAKLCVSNPEVVENAVAMALAQVDEAAAKNRPIEAVSIGENDASFNAFCLCERCEAMDHPDGKMVVLRYATGNLEHVSLTDRYMQFYNQVAEGVSRRHPELPVVGFAYGAFSIPPLETKAHPNLIIQYVGSDLQSPYEDDQVRAQQHEEWQRWASAGAKIGWRPNWLRGALGMPMLYHTKVADDIRMLHSQGLVGVDFDTMMNDWATQGLNYYVIAKMVWNPNLEARDLVRDYCDTGFGPASEQMQAYYKLVGDMTSRRAERHGTVQSWVSPEKWARLELASYLDFDFYDRAQTILNEAKLRVGDNSDYMARIQFVELGLRYARIKSRLLEATLIDPGNHTDSERDALAREYEEFLHEYKLSFAVNTPYAAYELLRHPSLFTGSAEVED